jgi:aryl-phospho-beta-D-glucosidase BglC (GH1 family)
VQAQLPTAQEIAGKMKLGWNLGNMLEAVWIPRDNYAATTQATIDSVKAAGFNTVRLPVAWHYHSNTATYVIDTAWLAHVKKTVDYCIKDSMYVVMNTHWDNGWLDDHINANDSASLNARQHAHWTQIANYFKDYGDHLLFASANEPPAKDANQMAILLSYHQTFINAVRATGGNNSSRTLVVQGPSTDIDLTNELMNTMPTDQIANRLIVEVHYYTPWQFCGLNEDANWGKMFYYWGSGYHSITDVTRNATWGEESSMDNGLNLMKTKFVDKGIPVIIGEYGAFRHNQIPAPSIQALHNASIEYFYRYFVKSATDKGIITYCWDTGGLFDFTTGKIKDKVVVNAIIKGGTDTIPVTDVSINENIDSLAIGATITLTATVAPLDATYKTVTWRSIEPAVATVSSAGLVTGLKVGKTIIYANADLKNEGLSIVVGIPATGVVIDPKEDTIKIGETKQLVATVSPSNASVKTVKWSSNNTTVVTVSTSGMVKAVSTGSAVITATTTDGSFKTTGKITVLDSATSVIQAIKPDDIAIFPNPLNGKQLTVDLGGLKGTTTIQFIQINGQTVLEQTVFDKQRTQLYVNLKPGIYMVRFLNNENTLLKKLVIN